MRTTLDIEDEILNKVLTNSGATSKKKAVESALREYVRLKHRQELIEMIGNYDDFDLTLKELDDLRDEL